VEVPAPEREESLERRGISILCRRSLGELARRPLELVLRREDAGAAREREEDGLAHCGPLLLEVPDRDGRRRARSGALVRLLEARDDPEQGRLADPVRADETGSGVRAEHETDLIENDLGAAVLRDAG